MTFVGKIFVVLNMFAAILFLGFAAADYSAKQGLQNHITKLETEKKSALDDAQQRRTAFDNLDIQTKDIKTKLETLKKDMEQQVKTRNDAIENVTKEAEGFRKQADLGGLRVKQTVDEVAARKGEVEQLQQIRKDLMDKNIKVQKELSDARDQIQDLKNQLEREREKLRNAEVGKKNILNYLASIKVALPPDDVLTTIAESTPPPQVEGIVNQVDGNLIEISLGENDGVKTQQRFQVWRTEPNPQYLGQVVVVSTFPNKAVVQPEGRMLGPVKVKDKVGVSSLLYR